MLSDYSQRQIVDAIYRLPELWGCVIIYLGNNQSKILSSGYAYRTNLTMSPFGSPQTTYTSNSNSKIIIVIEDLDEPMATTPKPVIKENQQFQGSELKGTVINCAFAAVSLVGVIGGGASEPLTFGLSSAVVVAGYAGLVSSGAQCLNSVARTTVAYAAPNDNSLERWDSNTYYSFFTNAIDVVGVVTGVVGVAGAAREIKTFLRIKNLLASEEELNAMTRAQKIEAFNSGLKRASQEENIAKELKKILDQMGRAGNRMARGNPVIIRRELSNFTRTVSDATANALSRNAKSIVLTSINLGLNGAPATFAGGASGTLNKLGNMVIHIIE